MKCCQDSEFFLTSWRICKFVENVSFFNERVERTNVLREASRLVGYFLIYLVREVVFYSGKSREILKSDVRGNHIEQYCYIQWLQIKLTCAFEEKCEEAKEKLT